MDLTKIKEMAERMRIRVECALSPRVGMYRDEAWAEAMALADAVKEIERLAKLAHVGWERARSEAEEAGNEEGETFAAETLDALEADYGVSIAEATS